MRIFRERNEPAQTPRRPWRERRGTVLIFALGVLAVISIMAVGYVAIVRIDRASSAAVARNVNFQQQVDAVVDYIGSMLSADLWGNKIVDTSIPRQSWPGMFEDGEYYDYPHVDKPTGAIFGTTPYTFNLARQGRDPSPNSILKFDASLGNLGTVRRFEVSPMDDAWLCSTEPAWVPYASPTFVADNNAPMLYWPQITNLRSAYTYDSQESGNIWEHRWVRMDGRFIDLGGFFKQPRFGYGNAGVDLLRRDLPPDSVGALGASSGVAPLLWAAPNGQTTSVFHMQMANMVFGFGNDPDGSVFTRADERFWADTDGDLRPDARWTELESLGNLFGLRWVVAARIIDASAFLNVNTALGFGGGSVPVGTGRTPADIDLYRFLKEGPYPAYRSGAGNNYAFRWRTDRVNQAWSDQVEKAIGYDDQFRNVLEDVNSFPSVTDLPYIKQSTLPTDWVQTAIGSSWTLQPLERDAIFEFATTSPDNPAYAQARHHPVRDMIDFHAFWGTNDDRVLSQFEQFADGPEVRGYLPNGAMNIDAIGPMWSRMPADESRQFRAPNSRNEQRPTIVELKTSTRRFLTAVSGVGPFSPVPVTNPTPQHTGKFFNEKINTRSFVAERDVPAAYEAFLWALAPLAVDLPLWLDQGNEWIHFGDIPANLRRNYHYGGGNTNSPVVRLEAETDDGDGVNIPVKDEYPVLVSAALAVNLADAMDEDNTPTVARYFTGRQVYEDPTTDYFELGIRTSFGDMIPGYLRYNTNPIQSILGDPIDTGSDNAPPPAPGYAVVSPHNQDGMTFVGLDRQPYIREVTTHAWYSDNALWAGSPEAAGSNADGRIQGATEQLGSMVTVELYNPWPDPLVLEPDRWYLVFPEEKFTIGVNGGGTALKFRLPGATIDPNNAVIFRYSTGGPSSANPPDFFVDELRTPLLDAMTGAGLPPVVDMTFEDAGFDETVQPVVFQNHADTDRPALLMYKHPAPHSSATEEYLLMDRVTPDKDTFFPRAIAQGDFDIKEPRTTGYDVTYSNLLGDITNPGHLNGDYYSALLGFTNADDDIDAHLTGVMNPQYRLTGRVLVSASLTRPSFVPDDKGFPTCVMAFNDALDENKNHNTVEEAFAVNAWVTVEGNGFVVPPTSGNPASLALANGPSAIVDPGGTPVIAPIDVHLGDPAELHWELANFLPGTKGVDTASVVQPSNVPPYQLFVPNEPLGAPSEIGLLSIYAHTCRNHDLENLREWKLAGERLADDLRADFQDPNAAGYPDASSWNRYLGVLDTSRYIPGVDLPNAQGHSYSQQHRLPLALRAFDCFETLPRRIGGNGSSSLIQGLVNVNTAPAEVLAMLPFVAPAQNITSVTGTVLNAVTGVNTPEDYPLVYKILGYRGVFTQGDPRGVPYPSRSNSPKIVGIPGLRASTIDTIIDKMFIQGFASHGELSLLQEHNGNTPDSADLDGIMRLGLDNTGTDAGAPFEIWNSDAPGRTLPGGGNATYASSEFNPRDDPEERMALYRALSTTTTNRSDVFIAWFVVRGYDPDAIEQIRMQGTANDENIALAMEDPNFRPVFNQRYMAVFDRSNIRLPIDRPQLLLLVQLPPTSP